MATEALSRAEIDGLLLKLFRYLEEDDENWLRRLRLQDPSEQEHLEKVLARDVAGRRELLRLNDLESGSDLVDQLLKKEGISVPRPSPEYSKLCRLALRAYLEAGRQKQAKFDGNYGLPIEDKLFEASSLSLAIATPSVPTPIAAPSGPAQDQVPNISLTEAIRLHVADMSRGGWIESTLRQNNATFRLFKDHMGETALSKVERRNVCQRRRQNASVRRSNDAFCLRR